MKSSKYRLVRVDYIGGYTQWNIERKCLWWWEYLDGGWEEGKMRNKLTALLSGTPYKKKEVMAHPKPDDNGEELPF